MLPTFNSKRLPGIKDREYKSTILIEIETGSK